MAFLFSYYIEDAGDMEFVLAHELVQNVKIFKFLWRIVTHLVLRKLAVATVDQSLGVSS